MRRRILLAVVFLALAAGAFGAGIWFQRQYQVATIRAAQAVARDMVGLDDPVPPAPPWAEWSYPGAKCKGMEHGLAVRLSGELVRPAGHYAVFVARDSFEDVARHYAERMRFEDPAAMARSRLAIGSWKTLQGESNFLFDDGDDPAASPPTRPVRAKCLARRCPSYDLTVLLTRADGETETHILLLYDPKKETADGQP